MSSKMLTKSSMSTFYKQIAQVNSAIKEAAVVVIGAGAGLSIAAGFSYEGKRFQENFSDFAAKYHFHDMYTGGFYPYPSAEEYWAYWSRYIMINRYQEASNPVYRQLLKLVREKAYFVITTNVDHCFQKAGFDKKRLFYTQGDYGLFQCSVPCCCKTYENEELIKKMVQEQNGMRIPKELLPVCSHCGKPMVMNLRVDKTFVEDAGWQRAAERYQSFLKQTANTNILFLEIGVGYNTPSIIKYPFWQMTAQNQQARYVCVNEHEAVCPAAIRRQAICIRADIQNVLAQLVPSF